MMPRAAAYILALVIDLVWGDPPNRYHPVAWMGRWIARLRPREPQGPLADLVAGVGMTAGGVAIWTLAGFLWERVSARVPEPLRYLLLAAAWKSTFAVRNLHRAAEDVRRALEAGNLAEARYLVGWHLVSRETATLSASEVAAAAIESVAENLSDGFVAPVLYGLAGGLPAAFLYRFVNTADAMVGYRDPTHEWLGKVPARLDDVLNFLPARITGLLIVLAAWLAGEDARGAWRAMRQDARQTPSPNAGYPMSAMAGALNVCLEKRGQYRLAAGFRPPQPADIGRSFRVMGTVVALVTGTVGTAAMGHALWCKARGLTQPSEDAR